MRTIHLLTRTSLAIAVLGLGVAMTAGCHRSDDSAAASPATAGNLQSTGGKKPHDVRGGGGGIPDMNDDPAPAGVKTGVQPGGLNR